MTTDKSREELLKRVKQLEIEVRDAKKSCEDLAKANKRLSENRQFTEAAEQKPNDANKPVVRNEENFRLLADNSIDVIWQMDLKLNFLYVSPSIYDLTGYTQEEWIGTHLSEHATRKEFLNMSRKAVSALKNYKKIKSITFEGYMLRKDGSSVPVEITGSILFNKKGLPASLQGSTRDISERIETIRLLKKNQEILSIGEQISNSGHYERNWQTGDGYWSEGFYRLLKADPDKMDCTHENLVKCFHPDDRERVEAYVAKCIKEKHDMDIKFRIVQSDGNIIYVRGNGKTYYDNHGKPLRTLGSFHDITEGIKYQERLKTALFKAEEADRLKSAFLANMSHEIRTPMNGIMGFVELLSLPDIDENDRLSYINVISRSCNRLLSTINNLINISKIEAGEKKLNLSKISINNMLDEIGEFFKAETDNKGLEISLEKNLSDESAMILADNEKLYAVITNLVKNAVKFTEKGRISIGYNLESENKKPVFKFFVRDTGIGIPEERQKAIFNRFEQAEVDYSKEYEGSGLGLSIAKAYIELMGGHISVESEPGNGSTFKFTIPADKKRKPKKTKRKKPLYKLNNDSTFENMTILIVEDDDASLTYLKSLLGSFSNRVLYARSGIEAIDICKKNHDINVILMDIKMPHMNGYDTTMEIRKFNNNVHIIAQTAYAMEGDRKKALEAGCNDYLAKPLRKDELLNRLINLNKQMKI